MVVNEQDPDPACLLLESGFVGHVRSICSMVSQQIAFPQLPKPYWPPTGNPNLGAGGMANSGGRGSWCWKPIICGDHHRGPLD
jgi:hypothetical protein